MLRFEAEGHRYFMDDEEWPSVSAVLEPLQILDGIPKDVLRAAAEFGSHVHMATDLYDNGVLDEDALDPHLKPYLDGWKSFLNETGAIVVSSELRVSHPQLRYAGTLDKMILWRDRRHVLDIKSSALVPKTVGPQTAAYREALLSTELVCAPTRYCMHLRGDGSYRLHTLRDSTDFNLFVSALNIHHWRARNGR